MSGSVTPAAYSAAAALLLSSAPIISDQEKVFQEALAEAKKNKESNGLIPAVFDNFIQAKSLKHLHDVVDKFTQERSDNKLWKSRPSTALYKKFTKLCVTVLQYKSLIDSLVSVAPKVGGPLWGSLAFLLSVFKELDAAEELLSLISKRIGATSERFEEHYRLGERIDRSLRSALRNYYRGIIEYAVDLIQCFMRSHLRSFIDGINGTVKDIVTRFDTDLKSLVDDVNWSSLARDQRQIMETVQIISSMAINGNSQHSNNGPAALVRTAGLPAMLLNKHFTGRQKELTAIKQYFMASICHERTQVAIFGMGGIGKTQILLQYAKDVQNSQSNPAYSCVFFIDARSSNTIRSSVDKVSRALGLRSRLLADTGAVQSDALTDWLQQREHWLMIFDNVNDINDIYDCLPDGTNGHILLSTRHAVIANTLARNTEPLEIQPFSDLVAEKLADRIAKQSKYDEDHTLATAREVAGFAKGLPLAIVQIINTALFAEQPISSVVAEMQDKKRLLELEDPVYFPGNKSTVGAIVGVNMEKMKIRNPVAEQLYRTLVYMNTSSISRQLLTRGIQSFPKYVERTSTFDRGRTKSPHRHVDVDVIETDLPHSTPPTERSRLWSLGRWRTNSSTRQRSRRSVRLPKEHTDLDESLRSTLEEKNPFSQLFTDDTCLDRALLVLNEAAMIKASESDLWIHDLEAQVAQALIERDGKDHNIASITRASALVYLAFPVPTQVPSGNRADLCERFLPHAISCHRYLEQLQILNSFSIGPELSHIIGSSLSLQIFFEQFKRIPIGIDNQRARAIRYYRFAICGYMACHRRLLLNPIPTQELVRLMQLAELNGMDRKLESDHFSTNIERVGRTPLMRLLETMLLLCRLLDDEPDEASSSEAQKLTTKVLQVFEIFYGRGHPNSYQVRRVLVARLIHAKQFLQARSVAMRGLQIILDDADQPQASINGEASFEGFTYSIGAQAYCIAIAKCHMQLPGKENGFMAARYELFVLNGAKILGGEEHYSHVGVMRRLGMAYEKAEDQIQSIYWWVNSVLCALRVLEWEELGDDSYTDPWCGAVLRHEEHLEESVAEYEAAVERIGPISEVLDSLTLRQFLGAVDMRIGLWRSDRLKHGSPYKKLDMRITEEDLLAIPCPWLDRINERNERMEQDAEERRRLKASSDAASLCARSVVGSADESASDSMGETTFRTDHIDVTDDDSAMKENTVWNSVGAECNRDVEKISMSETVMKESNLIIGKQVVS